MMKVVALCGSPRNKGNTYQALEVIKNELEKANIETEIITIGNKAINGCTACMQCFKNKDMKCVINSEVNDIIAKLAAADGVIIGSPVYFGSIAGNFKSALDRIFYVLAANDNPLRHKVGACLSVVRRSGGMTTYQQLNSYLNYLEMFQVSSNYWNIAHGWQEGEVMSDVEGLQILRILGKNMAYLIDVLAGSSTEKPDQEAKERMNFIR